MFRWSAKDGVEAFDSAVDRRVHVRSRHSDPDGSGRGESNGDAAGHPVARAAVVAGTKQDPSAAEPKRAARQCREHAVLRVGARLRANRVVGDDVNALHPQHESQAPRQPTV